MLRHRLTRPACVLAVLFAWLGISTAPPALAIDSAWKVDASGNWSDAANWTSGVPDAIGDIARLTYNITAARIVIIDTSSRTVGSLYLSDDNFGYTLVGVGLNLDVSSGSALIQSDGGTGVTHWISVPVALYDSTTVAANSATLQVVGISSSVAGTGITKTGAGTLVFRGLNTYTGATTISAGTLLLGANNAIPSGSSVTVQGGSTLDIGAYSTSAGTVTLVNGTITGTTGVLTGSDYDVRQGTISAKLGGSAGLTKRKGDTVVLSATNTFTGATTIEDGTLKLAAGAAMASKTFDVNAGATLDLLDLKDGLTLGAGQSIRGSGTVLGYLVAGGTVAPGSSPGILSVEDILFAAGGTLEVELGDTVRGSGYDVLASSGSVTLQDGSTLAVSLINAFVPEKGDAFDILDFAALSGQFGAVTLPALGENLAWNTDGLYTSGVIKVVPEPASAALLMAGLAGILLRFRRSAAARAAD